MVIILLIIIALPVLFGIARLAAYGRAYKRYMNLDDFREFRQSAEFKALSFDEQRRAEAAFLDKEEERINEWRNSIRK